MATMNRHLIPARQQGWFSFNPWKSLRRRYRATTIQSTNIAFLLKECLAKRQVLSLDDWASPSSAADDLAVVEILWCDATRDLFLQVRGISLK